MRKRYNLSQEYVKELLANSLVLLKLKAVKLYAKSIERASIIVIICKLQGF